MAMPLREHLPISAKRRAILTTLSAGASTSRRISDIVHSASGTLSTYGKRAGRYRAMGLSCTA